MGDIQILEYSLKKRSYIKEYAEMNGLSLNKDGNG
jgi:hypothetical protein